MLVVEAGDKRPRRNFQVAGAANKETYHMIPEGDVGLNGELSPEHRNQLAASGIPIEAATALHFTSWSTEQVRLYLGRASAVGPGLAIPYLDPDRPSTFLRCPAPNGTPALPYCRVRLDNPGLAVDKNGRPSKYLSRRSSGQQPYLTPEVARAICSGPAGPVFITEGEKKALAATLHGFPTIGLAGNWGWKVKNAVALLPLLNAHLPAGRDVVLVWDSDAAGNYSFAASTKLMHSVLRQRGCTLRVIVLPQQNTRKVGLDDYLMVHGADAFTALVNAADPLPSNSDADAESLLLQWLLVLVPALRAVDTSGAEEIVRSVAAKSLVNPLRDTTRTQALAILQSSGCCVNVECVFQEVVRGHVAEAYPEYATANTGSVAVCSAAVGAKVRQPDGKIVVVTRVDGDIAWVKGRNPATTAVPVSGLELIDDDHASYTELANELIEQHHVDGVLSLRFYCGVFWRWRDGAYVEMADDDVRAAVMGFLRERAPERATVATRNNLLAHLGAEGACHVPATASMPFDVVGPDPRDLVVLRNGILNVAALRAGQDDRDVLLPATPSFFSTNAPPIEWNLNAASPVFMRFLEDVQPDVAVRGLLQEIAGYLLVADTSLERFFVLVGSGANGKNVFGDVIAAMLGSGNVCSVPLSRFGERFALWPLASSLLNYASELPAGGSGGGMKTAEDKLKAIVSGNFIEVERKNKDLFSTRPTARLLFTTNELPPFADRSDGVWRRMIIAPFPVTVEEGQRDPHLARKIIDTELPGVFNWALEGLLRLRDRGRFEEPEACRRLKAEHRKDCDHEAEFLGEHCIVAGGTEFTPGDELYQAYQRFVHAAGYGQLGRARFSSQVGRVFPSVRADRGYVTREGQRRQVRGFFGLRYYPEGIPAPQNEGEEQT